MSGFGERLRSVRERLGWTRAFLSNQTGGVVTEGALEGLEYGARKQLSVEELLALSQALRVPPVWILTDIDDPDGHSDYPPLAHMENKEILRLFRQFRRPPCLIRPDDEDGEPATGSPGVAPPAVRGPRPASEARRTMRPGTMSVTDVARRLCCLPGLVEELSRRGYLPPCGDGTMTAAGLRKAIERHPWLRRLGNPLSHAELVELRCPVTRIPLGMGAAMGGRPYAPLRLLLANEWGHPDIGGYPDTPISKPNGEA